MKTTNVLRLLVLAAIAVGAGALAQSGGTVHEYVVPNHGTLLLAVPEALKDSSKPLSEPASVLIRFGPQNGDAFDVQVTSVWLDPAKVARSNPASLKATVASSAEELLQNAVEKKAEIKELRGTETTGFYYSLTDRAPAPGEYKYISQGVFLTGDLQSAFTILYREAACPEKDTVLQVFAKAKYVK